MPNGILAKLHNAVPQKDDHNVLTFQFKTYVIQVGRNALSNERLIKDHGHPECIWLHALAARGSHVILCIHERLEPADEIIQFAAKLALDHSHSDARTVKIALIKDVFKPEGGGVGVWKTSQNTSVEVQ